MRITRKSRGQPHFMNVVVRWTTRLSALITNPAFDIFKDIKRLELIIYWAAKQ